jgi:hypothetical protein
VAGLQHLGDPLQHAVRVVLQPRVLLQRLAGRQASPACHLERIQNQDDSVGSLQVAPVEFDAGLGYQIFTRGIKERQEGLSGTAGKARANLPLELEHHRRAVALPFGRHRKRRRGQLTALVEPSLVVAGEAAAGLIVGAGYRCAETVSQPVSELVHKYGHKHCLATVSRSDQRDQLTPDPAEVHGEHAVAPRADPDRGLSPGLPANRPVPVPDITEGVQLVACGAEAVLPLRVGRRLASFAVWPGPARAPEFDLPFWEDLVAVRARQPEPRQQRRGDHVTSPTAWRPAEGPA